MAVQTVAAPAAGTALPFDVIGGASYPLSKLAFGAEGATVLIADANGARLPVVATLATGQVVALDAATLAALETIGIAGTVQVAGPLTDVQLRAEPVQVAVAEPPARVLANNISLASGATGTQVTAVAAGSYIFEAIFTGADLQLQRLGPDGSTWINAGVLAASGSVGVVLAAGDTIRLRNNSGAAISGLWARVA